MQSINQKMMTGTVWMLFAKFTERGLGLISTLILVRLLLPEDFGVVALAMTVIAFLELMTSFGFNLVLIQKQNIEKYHYDTVWTLRLITYGAVTCIGLLIAEPMAEFFNDERIEEVIWVLSALMLLRTLQNIGLVDFTRDMKFNLVFWGSLARKLGSFLVTIPLAYYLRSYWALVLGMFFSGVLTNIFSNIVHPYRPAVSFKAVNEVFKMSSWLFLNNLIKFIANNAPKFVAGRLLGVTQVGYLSVADEIVQIPTTELVSAINKSTMPGYARKQQDLEDLVNSYLRVVSFIAVVSFPVCLGLAAVADPLVRVFLGDSWRNAIPIVEILAISYLFLSLYSNSGSVYTALGRPRLSFYVVVTRTTALLISLFLLGPSHGIPGIASAILVSAIAGYAMSLAVQSNILALRFKVYIQIIVRPCVSAIAMIVVVRIIDVSMLGSASIYIRLGLEILIGLVTYPLFLYGLWLASFRPDGIEVFLLKNASLVLQGFQNRQ